MPRVTQPYVVVPVRGRRETLARALSTLGALVGCQDSGCLFVEGGQRTNGGRCRCFDKFRVQTAVVALVEAARAVAHDDVHST